MFLTGIITRRGVPLLTKSEKLFIPRLNDLRCLSSSIIPPSSSSSPNQNELCLQSESDYVKSIINCRNKVEKAKTLLKKMEKESFGITIDSYNAYASVLVFSNQYKLVWKLLDEMNEKQLFPTVQTFETLLASFNKKKDHKIILHTMEHMKKRSIPPSLQCFDYALFACAHLGNDLKASEFLKLMKHFKLKPQLSHFNSIIFACQKKNKHKKAIAILNEMIKEGIEPDIRTYSAVISACGKNGEYMVALDYLNFMLDSDTLEPDVACYNSAMDACGRAEQWELGLELFKSLKDRNLIPTIRTYSAAISACEQCGQWEKALEIFDELQSTDLKPNKIVYTTVLNSLCNAQQVKQAFELFDQLEQNEPVTVDILMFDAMLRLCRDMGDVVTADKLMKKIKTRKLKPDRGVYSSLFGALALKNQSKRIIQEFRRIAKRKHLLNFFIRQTVLDACGEEGEWELALNVFNSLVSEPYISPNLNAFNSTLLACEKSQQYNQILGLHVWIDQLKLAPNLESYRMLLNATAQVGAPDLSFQLLRAMTQYRMKVTVDHYNQAIYACGKNNQSVRAYNFLQSFKPKKLSPSTRNPNKQKENIVANEFTYSTVVVACANTGEVLKALELLGEMEVLEMIPEDFILTLVQEACQKVTDESIRSEVLIHPIFHKLSK